MIRIVLLSVSMIMLSTSAYAERFESRDGCVNPGQECHCSNTGWPGKCDTTPGTIILYCHCGDLNIPQHKIPSFQCNNNNLGKQCVTEAGAEGTCKSVPRASVPDPSSFPSEDFYIVMCAE